MNDEFLRKENSNIFTKIEFNRDYTYNLDLKHALS